MRVLLELVMLGLAVISMVGTGLYFVFRNATAIAPDKCNHKRWTKWSIQDTQAIHLYAALDEGKTLPDRVDVYMTRECVRCGTPQAKTVRGIDSPHFK